jgi:hypothetical protein
MIGNVLKHRASAAALLACTLIFATPATPAQTVKQVVATMLDREREAAAHKDRFEYMSVERSDRTSGRAWTERVVETQVGRVRLLLAEDGKPISANRMQVEHDRLANDAAHPDEFEKREAAQKDEEAHARQMFDLLPKAFILENMRAEGGNWHIDFRPDPNYSPSGMEERVLHGMSGYILIDQSAVRLVHIEGRLPQDLSIGFGLVTVHAGSHFETSKTPFAGQWRTIRVISDIRGKAVLFKTIAKNTDVTRTEFKRVDNNLTVAQAAALVQAQH